MSETTQEERDQIIQRLAESDINVSDEVRGLICDAVPKDRDEDNIKAKQKQAGDWLRKNAAFFSGD